MQGRDGGMGNIKGRNFDEEEERKMKDVEKEEAKVKEEAE